MKRLIISALMALVLTAGLGLTGCDKERIVNSSERVQEIVKVTDTVFVRDTVYRIDSVNTVDTVTQYVGQSDTVIYYDTTWRFDTTWRYDTTYVTRTDTLIVVDTVVLVGGGGDTVFVDTSVVEHDTVLIHDTIVVTDSIAVFDTIVQVDTIVQTMTDTVYQTQYVHDTVTIAGCQPLVHFAYAAMHGWGDIEVIAAVNAQYGYNDGWVFWLSIYMTAIDNPSQGVYDFWGYIDYWSPDWNEFVPFEYGWRMTHLGGDASDPNNWQLSDAPGTGYYAPPGAVMQRPSGAPEAGATSGLRRVEDNRRRLLR